MSSRAGEFLAETPAGTPAKHTRPAAPTPYTAAYKTAERRDGQRDRVESQESDLDAFITATEAELAPKQRPGPDSPRAAPRAGGSPSAGGGYSSEDEFFDNERLSFPGGSDACGSRRSSRAGPATAAGAGGYSSADEYFDGEPGGSDTPSGSRRSSHAGRNAAGAGGYSSSDSEAVAGAAGRRLESVSEAGSAALGLSDDGLDDGLDADWEQGETMGQSDFLRKTFVKGGFGTATLGRVYDNDIREEDEEDWEES